MQYVALKYLMSTLYFLKRYNAFYAGTGETRNLLVPKYLIGPTYFIVKRNNNVFDAGLDKVALYWSQNILKIPKVVQNVLFQVFKM